jgi:hypothetical protein
MQMQIGMPYRNTNLENYKFNILFNNVDKNKNKKQCVQLSSLADSGMFRWIISIQTSEGFKQKPLCPQFLKTQWHVALRKTDLNNKKVCSKTGRSAYRKLWRP